MVLRVVEAVGSEGGRAGGRVRVMRSQAENGC